MRVAVSIFLVMQLLHLPVPCPDLDGECRGVPIKSLADGNAWHILLLGVRPNDDIDRGPIRPKDKDSNEDPSQSPFGDHTMVANADGQSGSPIGKRIAFEAGFLPDVDIDRLVGHRDLHIGLDISDGGPPITLRRSVLRI